MYFDHHQICVLVCSKVELKIDPFGSQKKVYSRASGQCSLDPFQYRACQNTNPRLKSFGLFSANRHTDSYGRAVNCTRLDVP